MSRLANLDSSCGYYMKCYVCKPRALLIFLLRTHSWFVFARQNDVMPWAIINAVPPIILPVVFLMMAAMTMAVWLIEE